MAIAVRLLAIASLVLLGCVDTSVRHPLRGTLRASRGESGYFIASDDDWIVVRAAAGDHGHRFQGSVTALAGSIGPLDLERAALADRIAAQGDSVQFDLELSRNADEGFRVRVPHGCARFDLYLDGAHRSERVHLGPTRTHPTAIPFERCP